MTFSITVSSLKLVNSGATFPADSFVLKSLFPPTVGFLSFWVVKRGTRTPCLLFVTVYSLFWQVPSSSGVRLLHAKLVDVTCCYNRDTLNVAFVV